MNINYLIPKLRAVKIRILAVLLILMSTFQLTSIVSNIRQSFYGPVLYFCIFDRTAFPSPEFSTASLKRFWYTSLWLA